jgi:excinuclease UvrABC helicase subunit UvrB
MSEDQKADLLDQMFVEMKKAAINLDFERAANLRDEIARIKTDEIVNS